MMKVIFKYEPVDEVTESSNSTTLWRKEMNLEDKLMKVNDSFSVNMYDNGFMFEISGRDHNEDWAGAKIVCNNLEELISLIKEASAMPRD